MSDRPPFLAELFDAATLWRAGAGVVVAVVLWLLVCWVVEWYTRDIGL